MYFSMIEVNTLGQCWLTVRQECIFARILVAPLPYPDHRLLDWA